MVSPRTGAASFVYLRIAEKLGEDKSIFLGENDAGLVRVIEQKISVPQIEQLKNEGFKDSDLELIIPLRTLRDRKKKNKPLTQDESDRALRLLRIQSTAEQTFGDADKADRWLHKSLSLLDGRTPMEYSATDAGGRVVEKILAKIAWGAAA